MRRIILLPLFLVISFHLMAQSQSLVAARDARAVQIVQSSLAAMGGQSAWASITSVSSEWTTTDASGASATQQWTDSWPQGKLSFQHVLKNSSGTHTLSSTNGTVSDIEPTGTVTLPKKVQELALPYPFPAAVLLLDLNNPAYQIRYRGLHGTVAELEIGRVIGPGAEDLYTRQEWQIDLSTGLPTQVTFYTLGLEHHGRIGQTLAFSDFQKNGNVIVPGVVTSSPTGSPVKSQLTSFTAQ